ncbi:MAG: cation transporter [Lentisphaerae bacterium]|nr:cation transporter [Lentisphaerota bacterium]
MITNFLIKATIPDWDKPEQPEVRQAYGKLCGSVGIAVNALLFGLKLLVGLLTGSVAVTADAINNLSDASSAVITLVGFKLSAKVADSEHPFGHGRLEYIAGLIVAVIILAVGVHFLQESVLKIFQPEKIQLSRPAIVLYAGTMLFKLWLFCFYRAVSRRISSGVLRASSLDSLSDLLITSVVLLAVLLAPHTDYPVDGIAGTLVALMVLVSGVKIIRDTIDPLLGIRPDKKLVSELRQRLLACEGISGIHDIIIHNYGPNQHFATAHAEVSSAESLLAVHDILEAAEVEIARTMPIRLILHCDPFITADPEVKLWHQRALTAVKAIDHKFKLYDFHLEGSSDTLRIHFNLLIPRNYILSQAEISEKLTAALQQYDARLAVQIDYLHSFV